MDTDIDSETPKKLRFAWALGVTKLYKLRSLVGEARQHTFDIIENSRLFFPAPDQFNDPFDCSPPFELGGDPNDPKFFAELQADEQAMAEEAGLTPDQMAELRSTQGVTIQEFAATVRENTLQALRTDTRLFCLATEQRHPLMWSHYAASHTGVCLHFRCDPGSLFGLARKVLYREERKPILIPLDRQTPDEVTERLVFEKAKFWEYEDEYRIVGHRSPGVDWGFEFDDKGRVSFSPDLLCGITLGMKIGSKDRADVTALALKHNPPIPLWQATEDPKRFWLTLHQAFG